MTRRSTHSFGLILHWEASIAFQIFLGRTSLNNARGCSLRHVLLRGVICRGEGLFLAVAHNRGFILRSALLSDSSSCGCDIWSYRTILCLRLRLDNLAWGFPFLSLSLSRLGRLFAFDFVLRLNMEIELSPWQFFIVFSHFSVVLIIVKMIEQSNPLAILPKLINSSPEKDLLRDADAAHLNFVPAKTLHYYGHFLFAFRTLKGHFNCILSWRKNQDIQEHLT